MGSAESLLGRKGPISHGPKQTGERSAGNPHATFDVAGAGNVMMAAGLRATAKAVEHPPAPNVGAPVLDPTRPEAGVGRERRLAIVGNEPQFASGVRHSRKAVTSLLARAFEPQRGLP